MNSTLWNTFHLFIREKQGHWSNTCVQRLARFSYWIISKVIKIFDVVLYFQRIPKWRGEVPLKNEGGRMLKNVSALHWENKFNGHIHLKTPHYIGSAWRPTCVCTVQEYIIYDICNIMRRNSRHISFASVYTVQNYLWSGYVYNLFHALKHNSQDIIQYFTRKKFK